MRNGTVKEGAHQPEITGIMVSRAGIEPATTALKVRRRRRDLRLHAQNTAIRGYIAARGCTGYSRFGIRRGVRRSRAKYFAETAVTACRVSSGSNARSVEISATIRGLQKLCGMHALSRVREHLLDRPTHRGEKFFQLRRFDDQTGFLQARPVLVTGRARGCDDGDRHRSETR